MIFYFTGTGNSLYVAKELDEEIISIPQVIKQERLKFAADNIGIVLKRQDSTPQRANLWIGDGGLRLNYRTKNRKV